jgi:hypothetical protein
VRRHYPKSDQARLVSTKIGLGLTATLSSYKKTGIQINDSIQNRREQNEECRDEAARVELQVNGANAEVKKTRKVFEKQKWVQWIIATVIKGKWQHLEDEIKDDKIYD